ncbi:MAG: zinc-binding alcohol dehydrogenase family protein [Planctomycetota bacterium]|nr:MAG: zinc-binding alcohol dehydrogenase family protein [Planctomycetota bacterium]
MWAMRLHEPGPIETNPLRCEEVPDPVPGEGALRIDVEVCGVCRTDLHQVEGDLPMRRRPVIPGHQVVGRVAEVGPGGTSFQPGERVGVAWLHQACKACRFCRRDRENLCERGSFTGWTVDGGYAQSIVVPADFAYRVPGGVSADSLAPLLCAGIIGYRALRACPLEPGMTVGLFGFGASAHITLQVAVHLGYAVFVFTRSEAHRRAAADLGAAWVGGAEDDPPRKLDGAVLFAPAGSLVPRALELLAPAATVVTAGIHMSDIPPLQYRRHLYEEKVLRSVANATRRDGRELLALADVIPIRTVTHVYPLREAARALTDLKHSRFTGSAVLNCRAGM